MSLVKLWIQYYKDCRNCCLKQAVGEVFVLYVQILFSVETIIDLYEWIKVIRDNDDASIYGGLDWKTAGPGVVMASSEYGTTMIIIHTGGKRYPIMVTFLASHEEIDAKNKIANLSFRQNSIMRSAVFDL